LNLTLLCGWLTNNIRILGFECNNASQRQQPEEYVARRKALAQGAAGDLPGDIEDVRNGQRSLLDAILQRWSLDVGLGDIGRPIGLVGLVDRSGIL
jgi:hypothetical protein